MRRITIVDKIKDIINDNRTLNSKFEVTSEKSEMQIFKVNSSSNFEENKLTNLNLKPINIF